VPLPNHALIFKTFGHVQSSKVVTRAAAEDQSTSVSVNGSGKDVPAVDFDELTDLIRYVQWLRSRE
jgi:hypothetical protein